jgi:uncharacterized protein (TIGR00251 family)
MAALPIPIRETVDGAIFRVRVLPRASRSEAAGIRGDVLTLRVTAAPVEGKANDECIRLLAEILGVKRTQVAIIAGHAARTKTVAVEGIKAEQIASLFTALRDISPT